MVPLRKRFADAAMKLPPVSESNNVKLETVTRCFLGGKLPHRIASLHRGGYAVRPCIAGVIFTAATYAPLGGRENMRLAAPLSRLSDALAYYFRASRQRGAIEYNLNETQAAVDAECLGIALDELAKLLVKCGVPVLNNAEPIVEVKWEDKPNEVATLLAYVTTLEARIIALENKLADNCKHRGVAVPEPLAPLHKPSPPEVIEKNIECPGIPSAF